MRSYDQKTHRHFLSLVTIPIGSLGSVYFYFFISGYIKVSMPLWMILFLVLLCFSGTLVGAEALWRINKFIDEAKK